MYNERTDIADIEKIIEEMIKLKKEIEEEIANGNEYDLSPEEKAAKSANAGAKKAVDDPTRFEVGRLSDYLIKGYNQSKRIQTLELQKQYGQ